MESEDGELMFSFSRHLMRAGSPLRRAMMLRTTGEFGTLTASLNLSLDVKLAGPVYKIILLIYFFTVPFFFFFPYEVDLHGRV